MAVKTHLAIVFADMSGSSRLYQLLGDDGARVVVERVIAAMADVVCGSSGQVMRVIGDEILAIFPSPDTAVGAAIDMQGAVADLPPVLGRRLAIRVGMHVGEVLQSASELYGDAVNVAARMASQAKSGEILVTGACAAALTPGTAVCRPIGWIDVKGQPAPVEICEIVWRSEDATMMETVQHAATAMPRRAVARMIFSREGREVPLSDDRALLTIGREEHNDLVVIGAKVSRQHAFVEIRNGRVVLVDQSANGTFIIPDAGPTAYLHRDSMVLTGAGTLALGEDPDLGLRAAIRYAATDTPLPAAT